MFSYLLLTAISVLIQGAFTAPGELIDRQGGYYYSFWSEGGGNFRCTNGAGGQYSATWSGTGGFVCGKGWSPGGSRQVSPSGNYSPTGPGYLAVYGWTRNPLIEYYIVESHGDLSPGEPWTAKGNFTFEEGTYELYTSTRVNKPSIVGTATFQQYWSVRTEKRVNGTVTTGRHFTEWANVGLRLGSHDYMILATEGYTATGGNGSSGTASITVT
ncbi:concanavalin A-like lectin/glucanase domain-containing protein [Pseudomassariella vexata]|uniref:Endo-1,4-beta-xylanase n=1 Tax=Pseudomassariella vexata TaxID=1141098 RepID=A0A1Y2EHE4_9PEZI|nr:concanavalin A-like lectin/glucanase domain-containing protein [Pseudomassariella vexata]ORY70989.1 concanavalin A-like lectin/glucanase domain-containing protein [Pseudomassariella vexata]